MTTTMKGLAPDRFFDNTFGRLRQGAAPRPDGTFAPEDVVPMRRVGYESHSALYDVEIAGDGSRRYFKNCKPSGRTRYHKAAEERYGLSDVTEQGGV